MHPQFTPAQVSRFWSKVHKTDGCWLWTGPVGMPGAKKGHRRAHSRRLRYGRFYLCRHPQRTMRAHRASYELAYGPIPDGLYVCHHCDNPLCVRPEHLFLGTAADNIHDALAKGRVFRGPRPPGPIARGACKARRGRQNGRARRTPEQIRAIRAPAAEGISQMEIARHLGVAQSCISEILLGKRWTDVL